jgi:hypothetical protein
MWRENSISLAFYCRKVGLALTAPATTTSVRTNNVQRVLIVDNQLLVGAGIQALLTEEVDLDVIGSPSLDLEELAQIINSSEPDVIVLDADGHLTRLTGLLPLLNNFSKLQIVVISAQDDLVCVYNKREVLITRPGQLLNIIRAG